MQSPFKISAVVVEREREEEEMIGFNIGKVGCNIAA